jgi:hypothetical protein
MPTCFEDNEKIDLFFLAAVKEKSSTSFLNVDKKRSTCFSLPPEDQTSSGQTPPHLHCRRNYFPQ